VLVVVTFEFPEFAPSGTADETVLVTVAVVMLVVFTVGVEGDRPGEVDGDAHVSTDAPEDVVDVERSELLLERR
jgi:hypothetical protein